jgi:cytidylate kinase|tara:strand:- start:135 stop:797 length:663 start_codon:yes stop_codon:yes gene_type:complete
MNTNNMNLNLHIAIDGPAASGKTDTGKLLAQELGISFLDTGLMYRAITYYFINSKLDDNKLDIIHEDIFDDINIEVSDSQNVILNNIDISKVIFSDDVNNKVSIYAGIQSIRENLVKKQQLIAENNDIVMVGRDIGTVVLPSAKFKFFLDCSLNTRAMRRMHQSDKKKFTNEKDKLNNRDFLDKNREISPLLPSDDAVIVFNDHINLNETVELIKNIVLN